jgi:hypothetical protein
MIFVEHEEELPPTPADSPAEQGQAIGCGFWFLWTLATVAGTGLGWLAGWWLSFRIPGQLSTAMLGLVVGLTVGALQWAVLRPYLPGIGWILASTFGWGIGFALGVRLAYLSNLSDIAFGLAVGATTGLMTGILEWLVLRGRTPHAAWWIPASVFGWTAALFFYRAGLSAIGAYYGLLVGMVSGWAMLGILSFARGSEPD